VADVLRLIVSMEGFVENIGSAINPAIMVDETIILDTKLSSYPYTRPHCL
jgi:hypothetical protein